MESKGVILWLTGLSGSGKTTIAKGVERELRERYCLVELLDGDVVRTNLLRDKRSKNSCSRITED